MKKSILTTVLICFSLTSLCYAVEPVIISVDLANPPFMYAENGKAAGLYPLLVQAVFRKMEIPVTIQPLPWKRAIKEADAGNAGIAGIYKNNEREKKYDYSQALFQEKLVIFVRKENLFSYQKIDDLKGKNIGVIRGWSYGEEFDAARKRGIFVVEEAKGDAQNFKKLLRNRIDCVIATEESGQSIALKNNQKDISQMSPPVAINPTYLIFSKKAEKTALLSQFDATVAKMMANGDYTKILDTFFSQQ